ncbi:MAG TPA: NAD(P)H-dependent oxidoreductase [Thermoanaerobaculia bacterium]|jgi:NAD(P)H-dependent FMN reductase|nr:NAD(P)H-dependent oxidoreductase [Thermoanaerobaculia bacterium]
MNRFAIVSGSHRSPSQTGKVARFIQQLIASDFEGVDTYLLDLGETPLPLWDPGLKTAAEPWCRVWSPVSAELKECTGAIVVTPEWSGMVPAALKNFFLLCEQNELSHKPGLIVAVSSGVNGAYPVAELRMSSYKNTQFCYIPEHIIVRNVRSMLNELGAGAPEEAYLRGRLKYALMLLVEYAEALKAVRNSGVADLATYPFGM